MPELHIILHEPEIPPNTGNIVRTCAALGAQLHLIHPLGFTIDEASIKRAGLDYWQFAQVSEYKNIDDFFERTGARDKVYFLTTKAKRWYSEIQYPQTTWLMFGKETQGLPQEIRDMAPERAIRLPMGKNIRSLNLSNAVAVCAFEVYRQSNFSGLE